MGIRLLLPEMMDVTSPYIPSSTDIITAIGKRTGIPVANEFKKGARNPIRKAIGGDRKNPDKRIGRCIGKNILPSIPLIWKMDGKITETAKKSAA